VVRRLREGARGGRQPEQTEGARPSAPLALGRWSRTPPPFRALLGGSKHRGGGPRRIAECHPSEGGELKNKRAYGLSVSDFYWVEAPSLGVTIGYPPTRGLKRKSYRVGPNVSSRPTNFGCKSLSTASSWPNFFWASPVTFTLQGVGQRPWLCLMILPPLIMRRVVWRAV
jgi:hypothetical protein